MNLCICLLQCLFILLHFFCYSQNPALNPGITELPTIANQPMDLSLQDSEENASFPSNNEMIGTATQEAQMLQGPDIINLTEKSSLKASHPESLKIYNKNKNSIVEIRKSLTELEKNRDQIEKKILEIDSSLTTKIIAIQTEAGRYQQIIEMKNEPGLDEVENET